MTSSLLIILAIAILIVTPPLGGYIARVMEGERTFLSPVLAPVERVIYRILGVDPTVEQGWKGYTVSMLLFSLVAIVGMYLMLRLQDVLPLNPTAAPAMSPELAFNTAVSFETNTNWQNYTGETSCQPPHPDGRPRRPQLHLGCRRARGRHRARARPRAPHRVHHRQLLGRSHPLHAVPAAAHLHRGRPRAGLAGRAPDLRRLRMRDHHPGCAHRPSRWARSRPRSSSRSWAPTAAASSTPTPRTRFENPTGLTNCARDASPS